jgi:hypothetical protein
MLATPAKADVFILWKQKRRQQQRLQSAATTTKADNGAPYHAQGDPSGRRAGRIQRVRLRGPRREWRTRFGRQQNCVGGILDRRPLSRIGSLVGRLESAVFSSPAGGQRHYARTAPRACPHHKHHHHHHHHHHLATFPSESVRCHKLTVRTSGRNALNIHPHPHILCKTRATAAAGPIALARSWSGPSDKQLRSSACRRQHDAPATREEAKMINEPR